MEDKKLHWLFEVTWHEWGFGFAATSSSLLFAVGPVWFGFERY
jgi:hypothetical protein